MASWVMGKGKGQRDNGTTKEKTERNEEEGLKKKAKAVTLVLLSALVSNEISTFGPLRGFSVFRLICPIITQHMTPS